MLTPNQTKELRDFLENSQNPLFFFDDDPDGLCSFLLFYRLVKRGRGVVVKIEPELNDIFLKKIEEYSPDTVFILDKPLVSQDFIDKAQCKLVWLDHHAPIKRHNVHYFNPRLENIEDGRPTSFWAYKTVNQDLWIAMIGIVGDWFVPEFASDFSEKYPDLLPKQFLKFNKPERIIYETKLGELIRIFSFNLKGKTKDVLTSVKIFTRINSPYDILKQSTPAGKYIYKRYLGINKEYQELLDLVSANNDNFLIYIYDENRSSFTGDLSNELIYKYPEKIIIVGRKKSGEVRCSLRSTKVKLPKLIEKALNGVEGYGGGHDYACGACIKERYFDNFIENLRREIG